MGYVRTPLCIATYEQLLMKRIQLQVGGHTHHLFGEVDRT